MEKTRRRPKSQPSLDFYSFFAIAGIWSLSCPLNILAPRPARVLRRQPPTMATKEPLTSKKYVDGIYIPAGLIVLGTAICKREWLPYAVVVALALGAIKFLRTRKSPFHLHRHRRVISRRAERVARAAAHHKHHRAQEGPQARLIPGVRAQGEDHPFAQHCHVSPLCPGGAKGVFCPSSSYAGY